MRSKLFAIPAVLILLVSTTALGVGTLQLDVAKPNYVSQRATINLAINGDEDYAETSSIDRKQISESLVRIDKKLSTSSSFDQLSDADKLQVLDDQVAINKSLSKASMDSKIICKHEAALGSNLRKRVCQTQAARNRQNDEIRKAGELKRSN